MSYIITGLPRTGTTWLSQYLSHGFHKCYHELLAQSPSFDSYMWVLRKFNHGHAGSDALLWLDHIRERSPKTKIIYIDRDPFSIERSLRRAGLPYHDRLYNEAIVRYALTHADLMIPWHNSMTFRNEQTIREIHEIVGTPFDKARWEEFCKLHITTDPSTIKHRAEHFRKNFLKNYPPSTWL